MNIDWDVKIEALYGYWVDHIQMMHFASLKDPIIQNTKLPSDFKIYLISHVKFRRVLLGYALLYVVIEAYIELKLSDKKINNLLGRAQYLSALKSLRNSLFHYRKNPESNQLMRFINLEYSEKWIKDLSNAFEKFFIHNLPIKKILSNLNLN